MKRAIMITNAELLELWHTKYTLTNKDIGRIFGVKSQDVIWRIKRDVFKYAKEKGIDYPGARYIDTKAAFMSWGIDPKDLARRVNQ